MATMTGFEVLGYAIAAVILAAVCAEVYIKAKQSIKRLLPRGEVKNDGQTNTTKQGHANKDDDLMHSDCFCKRCIRQRNRRSKWSNKHLGNHRVTYGRNSVRAIKIEFASDK